ncbi:hypothetical protein [Nonomuraea candida]|uniref:hypothetical protein n=1 Tax=Nonomuraea candida TaxID=359159 RepID=UPI0005BDAB2A|nr:hypothetical protein [Nonomuraea candida]
MAARSRAGRLTRSIAIAIAAIAAALLPLSPAHAAYGPDQPVSVQVNATDPYNTPLARLQGTVAFDDGTAMFRYSLQLCWLRAYPAPNLRIFINGTTQHYPVSAGSTTTPGCQQTSLYAAEVNHGAAIANVRFDVTAGWFYPGMQYNTRTRSFTSDNPFT